MATVSHSAAASHVGKIRSNNQDSGYSGQHLFLVADGMGGHAGGDVASAIATKRIIEADRDYQSPQDAEFALQAALIAANSLLAETVYEHTELTGMGTTVSALIVLNDEVAIAHIGDSRIYLLRQGELSQITIDHTFVQRLVDSGRITEQEAMVHPRRSVLMRVLGDVEAAPEIDTSILATFAGDRWLICSDGLSGVVSNTSIAAALSSELDPQGVADRLVKESLDGGAPDNVTIVVVDIGAPDQRIDTPIVVGSASAPLAFGEEPGRSRALRMSSLRLHPVRETHFEPDSQDYLTELIEEDARRARRRKATWLAGVILLIVALVGGGILGYQWTQTRYYVGVEGSTVAIFRGVQQDLGPISLHSVYEETPLQVTDLRVYDRQQVEQTISAASLDEARLVVERLTKAKNE
ncbi:MULTISPECIES: PP2C family protein-serine/threonine phosphatase [unclassified Cryobacterium]|uniref:PP2C family protein-serine/threonine phosphatase n=1 Tax=unclassified Cryobacterium TaxID=2649013 RepID=UPI00106C0209|nr:MULTISPECIES: PP2C family serine/threonine-protein phosphatase [unclassified Cryobacterium]MDY7529647.1 protein phosphatase 2C domain-containing protein [Cryobacterium sp. 10C2]MDY7558214.1 protein phosphatase 2C domain-containing protein [Cryobacterium sp. 10C3]MEB0003703.1 protein phosphatase 2C domain-containing protein [Cryobacterium sp. RTC2.1]MEB0202137.1 protein phosphatase 2C domain-containing protein [Cryobacterium sp. 5I3]MEB0286848.1 protein phosphatase 2C domain-containing prote